MTAASVQQPGLGVCDATAIDALDRRMFAHQRGWTAALK